MQWCKETEEVEFKGHKGKFQVRISLCGSSLSDVIVPYFEVDVVNFIKSKGKKELSTWIKDVEDVCGKGKIYELFLECWESMKPVRKED